MGEVQIGAGLAEAVAAAGTDPVELVLSDVQVVDADLIVPGNVTLRLLPGALIDLVGASLVIEGGFICGRRLAFTVDPTSDVSFGGGHVSEVYPEWWQTNDAPGTTDCTYAIEMAIASLRNDASSMVRGIVSFAATHYAFTSIVLHEGIHLRGQGWSYNTNGPFGDGGWNSPANEWGTWLKHTDTTGVGISLAADDGDGLGYRLAKLGLVGAATVAVPGDAVGLSTVMATYAAACHKFLDDVFIGNFDLGLDLDHFIGGSLNDLTLKGCSTGARLGATINPTNVAVYNLDVQQCGVGIDAINVGGFNFYGGLVQSNGIGIRLGDVTEFNVDGFWFELNGADWETPPGFTRQNLAFRNCRSGTPWTWQPEGNNYRWTFQNCQLHSTTLDMTADPATNRFSEATFDSCKLADVIHGDPGLAIGLRLASTNLGASGAVLDSGTHTDTQVLGPADIESMATRPPLVLGQPDTVLEFVSAVVVYNPGADAFTGNLMPLVIEYSDGTDVSVEFLASGLLDATTRQVRRVSALSGSPDDDLGAAVYKTLQIRSTGGAYAGGDGTLVVHVTYRRHYVG